MREPEGIAAPLPGRSWERPWSKHRGPHIRNVGAEGSSPFTSTKGPGQRPKVGSPRSHEAPLSATWTRRRGRRCELAGTHQRARSRADSRISVTVGGANLGAACLYVSLSTKSGSPETDEFGKSQGSTITEPAVAVSIDVLLSRIAYQHPTRR